MKALESRIFSIFQNNTALRIPFFQRPYVWDVEQWRKFVDDIQFVATSGSPFFLGSIIRKEEPVTIKGASEQYGIIDGQQRLTTLVLFLKALQKARNEDQDFRDKFIIEDLDLTKDQRSTPILQHNNMDRAAFNNICNDLAAPVDSQIGKAYQYFVDFLNRTARHEEDKLSPSLTLNQIFLALRDKVNLVDIKLEPADQEQQIFDTINSAGCDLTTGQLLKNYFFNQSFEALYNSAWRPAFEESNPITSFWADKITSGKTSDTHIEQFCYAFMQVKIANGSVAGLTEADKKEFRHRNAGMFRNYKLLVERYKLDKQEFIVEFLSFARLYLDNFNVDIEKCAIPASPGFLRLLCIMKATNTWTPVPFLLYILHEVADAAERDSIFGYLEKYLLHRLICKRSNNNYSDFFSENLIGQHITSLGALKAYVDAKEANDSLSMPSDTELLEAVGTNDLSGNTAKILLYMTESALTQNPQFPSYSAFAVLPLIPKSSRSGDVPAGWPLEDGYNADMRSALCNTLGNWAIANSDKTLPKSVIALPWQPKYLKLRTMLAASAATNAGLSPSVLTDSLVEERSEELLDLYQSYWSAAAAAAPEAEEPETEEIEVEFVDAEEPEEQLTAGAAEVAGLATVAAASLPGSLPKPIWEYYTDKEYRRKYRIYLLSGGMTLADMKETMYRFSVYLTRIKGALQPMRYNRLTDVREFKDFLDEVEQMWVGRNKYPDAPGICVNYLDFIRRLEAEQVKVDPAGVRQREFVHVTLTAPDGTEYKGTIMDAIETLVKATGVSVVFRKPDFYHLKNKPLVVQDGPTVPVGYRTLEGGYRLNNLGSPKDKKKELMILNIGLHNTWKIQYDD